MLTLEVYLRREGTNVESLREEIGNNNIVELERNFYFVNYVVEEKQELLRIIDQSSELEGFAALRVYKRS